MALDRLHSVAHHVNGTGPPPHPFDPLSNAEIETAVHIVRTAYGKVAYNAVTLYEPRKKEMLKWIADPVNTPRPARVADLVVLVPGGKVIDALVSLDEKKIIKWEQMDGVQPLVRENLNRIWQVLGLELTGNRLPWKTCKLSSSWSGRIPKSSNNV
jgi:primary-amine oxidase